jgi:methanol metabolism-related c-type cytochrome
VTGFLRGTLIVIALLFAGVVFAAADGPGNPKAVKEFDGEWTDAQGVPTYHIGKDGTVDYYTFIGYLRFNSICMVCHGPDGLGSSYGPNLTESLQHLSYAQFLGTVAAGKKSVNTAQDLVMPALGTDKNVMCFINEIYVYLRARSTGALGRGRPEKHAPAPAGFDKASYECLGIPM